MKKIDIINALAKYNDEADIGINMHKRKHEETLDHVMVKGDPYFHGDKYFCMGCHEAYFDTFSLIERQEAKDSCIEYGMHNCRNHLMNLFLEMEKCKKEIKDETVRYKTLTTRKERNGSRKIIDSYKEEYKHLSIRAKHYSDDLKGLIAKDENTFLKYNWTMDAIFLN